MKNFKRIAALAGVVILLLVFCLPMVFAWGSSENSQALFRGAFAAAGLEGSTEDIKPVVRNMG